MAEPKFKYFEALESIRKRTDLGIYARYTYRELAARADAEQGTCYPSYARIARDTGMSRRTVIRAVKELVEAGILTLKGRAAEGLQITNLFTIRYAPPLPAVSSSHHPIDDDEGVVPTSHHGSVQQSPPQCPPDTRGSAHQSPELSTLNSPMNCPGNPHAGVQPIFIDLAEEREPVKDETMVAPQPPTPPPHLELVDYFKTAYSAIANGAEPTGRLKMDTAARLILKELSLVEGKSLIDKFFASSDPFWARNRDLQFIANQMNPIRAASTSQPIFTGKSPPQYIEGRSQTFKDQNGNDAEF